MAGSDPAGACTGAVTCNAATPTCPDGQVALVKDGCFTGECRAIAVCEAPPTCGSLQHEGDCKAATATCDVIQTGHNCTGTCPGPDCKCTSYTFASCADKGTANTPLIELN